GTRVRRTLKEGFMIEAHTLFTEKPFSYKVLKDKTPEIRFRGTLVKTISGKEFNKLERVIAMDNQPELQLFLAKVTGTEVSQ
ncbi:MAG TPA: hypothetical protein PKO22_07695, partial [Treponemataceae bacterium]|nr:hypothetical protein [Treponemataceae bacterium]